MDAAGMFAFMSTAAAGGVPVLPGAFDNNGSLGMGSGFPRSLGDDSFMATSMGDPFPGEWGNRE
jgi:hypothetical protein